MFKNHMNHNNAYDIESNCNNSYHFEILTSLDKFENRMNHNNLYHIHLSNIPPPNTRGTYFESLVSG